MANYSLQRLVILGQVGEWSLGAHHDFVQTVLLHPEIVINVVLLLFRLVTARAAGFFVTLLGLLLLGLLPGGGISCDVMRS